MKAAVNNMTTSLLSLVNVSKSYPHPAGAVNVLRSVTAQFAKADKAAILGPSGSGKSTLLALLAGLDQPSSGEIFLKGQALHQLSERDLTLYRAENLGIIFQQFHLLSHLTALENVTLPLAILGKDLNSTELARFALASVGLDHRLKHYPRELSGGECQRVAIARALVARPSLLLADEPSGNLDAKTGLQVMELLFDLTESTQTTLILVTHNEQLALRCDRRFYLADGLLREASS
jgi:putative ABC transport system ATP-binding protein